MYAMTFRRVASRLRLHVLLYPRFLALVLLVLCWVAGLALKEYNKPPPPPPEDPMQKLLLPFPKLTQDRDFLSAAINVTLEDGFDYSAIKEVCSKSSWDNKLVFRCEVPRSGPSDVKQILLHCMRYAMDAGAGIVVPSLEQHDGNNANSLQSGWVGLDYMFDKDRFFARMSASCPQMSLYETEKDLQVLGPVTKTKAISPKEAQTLWSPATSIRRLVRSVRATGGEVSLVPLMATSSYYPVCHDSERFATAFSQLLPIRMDAHTLAAKIVRKLSQNFHAPLNPSYLITPGRVFLGIHLGTAADMSADRPTAERQAKYYSKRIRQQKFNDNLKAIYLAGGDVQAVTQFKEDVAKRGVELKIVTKEDLLAGKDLETLHALSADQMALVDYLVLLRSTFFLGVAESSFSWAVAMKRRAIESGTCTAWTRSGFWNGYLFNSAYNDEFNDLLGGHPYDWEVDMWP